MTLGGARGYHRFKPSARLLLWEDKYQANAEHEDSRERKFSEHEYKSLPRPPPGSSTTSRRKQQIPRHGCGKRNSAGFTKLARAEEGFIQQAFRNRPEKAKKRTPPHTPAFRPVPFRSTWDDPGSSPRGAHGVTIWITPRSHDRPPAVPRQSTTWPRALPRFLTFSH